MRITRGRIGKRLESTNLDTQQVPVAGLAGPACGPRSHGRVQQLQHPHGDFDPTHRDADDGAKHTHFRAAHCDPAVGNSAADGDAE